MCLTCTMRDFASDSFDHCKVCALVTSGTTPPLAPGRNGALSKPFVSQCRLGSEVAGGMGAAWPSMSSCASLRRSAFSVF